MGESGEPKANNRISLLYFWQWVERELDACLGGHHPYARGDLPDEQADSEGQTWVSDPPEED